MNYTIISGSNRKESGSRKVADFLGHQLKKIEGSEVEIIDLHELDLPVWKDSMWSGDNTLESAWDPARQSLVKADGYIIISPEWSGMASPALKNFILYVKKEMAHKPTLLVGVSSGRGGAYPISELRMSSYKNTFINYIPDQLIVRDVKNVLTDLELSENDSETDTYIKERSIQTLKTLHSYTKAFVQIREEGEYNFGEYGNGM